MSREPITGNAKTDGDALSGKPLRLRVSPTAEWKLRSGHPWLFSESVLERNRAGHVGDLAVIYDRYDNFLAIGLFDPESPIRVRILHKGKPRAIDVAFWQERVHEAVERRKPLFDDRTTGFRLIHGENDGWPGLVLDRYAETLVLKLYSQVWLPRLGEIGDLIFSALQPERIVLRLSRNLQSQARSTRFYDADGRVLHGAPLDGAVTFLESGLQFEADVLRGQKTGFFLDQRENRRLVESLAADRKVLNLFSFAGGFSLYAARGGAAVVTDLDISEHALESARRNFALNKNAPAVQGIIGDCPHHTIKSDAFEWLEAARAGQFGMVIVDPPSLARRESEREGALGAYSKLAESAIRTLRSGGILVASSCSAHVSAEEFFDVVRDAAETSRRSFTELRTTRHPADHPATFPEAHYLKTIFLAF